MSEIDDLYDEAETENILREFRYLRHDHIEILKPFGKSVKWMAWRSVLLGAGNGSSYHVQLMNTRCELGSNVRELGFLEHPWFPVEKQETSFYLGCTTIANLGFPKGGNYVDVFAKTRELQLRMCPPEVGPRLRLEYTDQPNNEKLYIWMFPLEAPGEKRYVWVVDCVDGRHYLKIEPWGLNRFFQPDERWVFSTFRWSTARKTVFEREEEAKSFITLMNFFK